MEEESNDIPPVCCLREAVEEGGGIRTLEQEMSEDEVAKMNYPRPMPPRGGKWRAMFCLVLIFFIFIFFSYLKWFVSFPLFFGGNLGERNCNSNCNTSVILSPVLRRNCNSNCNTSVTLWGDM